MHNRTCHRCGRSFSTSIPGVPAICLECLRTFVIESEHDSERGGFLDDVTPTQPKIILPIRL